MNDSITHHYTLWLKQYYSQEHDPTSLRLIKNIAAISHIDALILLFSQYLKPEFVSYGSIPLYAQISKWKSDLEKVVLGQQKALDALETIVITAENKNLLMLLKEILENHELLLHRHIPILLQTLCDSAVPDLIKYIIQLPQAHPLSPSFVPQAAKSEQHAACIALLNNTAAQSLSKHPLWRRANTLVHTALVIYQELDLVEVSLDPDKAIPYSKYLDTFEKKLCSIV